MTIVAVQISDCREVVRQLTECHDWQLLDEETFSHQLFFRAQLHPTADNGSLSAPETDSGQETLVKLAVNLYCETWHAACSATDERRARAYTELARYLYDRAWHKYGDRELAQELAHDAIVLVAEQIDNCQKPGAFLAFALLKLWNAATKRFRQRDRHAKRNVPILEPTDESETGVYEIEGTSPSPDEIAVTTDLTATLLARVGELMQQAPRARDQFRAVLLKFLAAYSDEEIAQELATEVKNVHVLRSRGLKRLREDPVLRQLFEETIGS